MRISYAHQDKAAADAACAKIEADVIRCWIAPRDVPPGAEWAGAIINAIDNCRVMVLIFSSSSNGSRQIDREAQRAFDKEKSVIPFRIEDVDPQKSLAYYLGPVHWLDALTPPFDQHLQKLSASVKAFVQADKPGEDKEPLTLQKTETRQEAETKRLAEEQERQRLESEAAASREAEECARQAAVAEAESRRRERDAAAAQQAEAQRIEEEQRQQQKAETKRHAEEDAQRKKDEADAQRIAEERKQRDTEANRRTEEKKQRDQNWQGSRADAEPQTSTLKLVVLPWKPVETPQQAKKLTIVGMISVATLALLYLVMMGNSAAGLVFALLCAGCAVGTYFNSRVAAVAGFVLSFPGLVALWPLSAFAGVRGTFATSRFRRASK